MTILKKGDQILDFSIDIENHVLEYFTSLYATENVCEQNDLIDKVIPKIVSTNEMLCLPISHHLMKLRMLFSQ